MEFSLLETHKLGYGCKSKEGEDILFHYSISDATGSVISQSISGKPRQMRLDRRLAHTDLYRILLAMHEGDAKTFHTKWRPEVDFMVSNSSSSSSPLPADPLSASSLTSKVLSVNSYDEKVEEEAIQAYMSHYKCPRPWRSAHTEFGPGRGLEAVWERYHGSRRGDEDHDDLKTTQHTTTLLSTSVPSTSSSLGLDAKPLLPSQSYLLADEAWDYDEDRYWAFRAQWLATRRQTRTTGLESTTAANTTNPTAKATTSTAAITAANTAPSISATTTTLPRTATTTATVTAAAAADGGPVASVDMALPPVASVAPIITTTPMASMAAGGSETPVVAQRARVGAWGMLDTRIVDHFYPHILANTSPIPTATQPNNVEFPNSTDLRKSDCLDLYVFIRVLRVGLWRAIDEDGLIKRDIVYDPAQVEVESYCNDFGKSDVADGNDDIGGDTALPSKLTQACDVTSLPPLQPHATLPTIPSQAPFQSRNTASIEPPFPRDYHFYTQPAAALASQLPYHAEIYGVLPPVDSQYPSSSLSSASVPSSSFSSSPPPPPPPPHLRPTLGAICWVDWAVFAAGEEDVVGVGVPGQPEDDDDDEEEEEVEVVRSGSDNTTTTTNLTSTTTPTSTHTHTHTPSVPNTRKRARTRRPRRLLWCSPSWGCNAHVTAQTRARTSMSASTGTHSAPSPSPSSSRASLSSSSSCKCRQLFHNDTHSEKEAFNEEKTTSASEKVTSWVGLCPFTPRLELSPSSWLPYYIEQYQDAIETSVYRDTRVQTNGRSDGQANEEVCGKVYDKEKERESKTHNEKGMHETRNEARMRTTGSGCISSTSFATSPSCSSRSAVSPRYVDNFPDAATILANTVLPPPPLGLYETLLHMCAGQVARVRMEGQTYTYGNTSWEVPPFFGNCPSEYVFSEPENEEERNSRGFGGRILAVPLGHASSHASLSSSSSSSLSTSSSYPASSTSSSVPANTPLVLFVRLHTFQNTTPRWALTPSSRQTHVRRAIAAANACFRRGQRWAAAAEWVYRQALLLMPQGVPRVERDARKLERETKVLAERLAADAEKEAAKGARPDLEDESMKKVKNNAEPEVEREAEQATTKAKTDAEKAALGDNTSIDEAALMTAVEHEEDLIWTPLRVLCFSNISSCLGIRGLHMLSQQATQEALRWDPYHVKSLYKHAQVCYKRGEWEDALKCVEKALSVVPEDTYLLALKKDIVDDLKRQEELQKKRMQRAFQLYR